MYSGSQAAPSSGEQSPASSIPKTKQSDILSRGASSSKVEVCESWLIIFCIAQMHVSTFTCVFDWMCWPGLWYVIYCWYFRDTAFTGFTYFYQQFYQPLFELNHWNPTHKHNSLIECWVWDCLTGSVSLFTGCYITEDCRSCYTSC